MRITTLLVDFRKGGAGSAIAAFALLGMTACASVRDKEAPASTAAATGPVPAAPVCPKIDWPPSPPAGWTYLPEIAALCVADIFHLDARAPEGQPSPQIVIAVKFDNGQDLTYMWSASLEPGTGFRCPLPGWDMRETHVVLRSGPKDLGQWLHEGRNIRADYAKYVGGRLPTRITHVWLIANTIFHQGAGDARFGDINLGAGGKASWTRVL